MKQQRFRQILKALSNYIMAVYMIARCAKETKKLSSGENG